MAQRIAAGVVCIAPSPTPLAPSGVKGEGVHNAFLPKFVALVEKGAQIVLCSHNLAERQRPKIEGAIVCGSQYDHAQLVSTVDRYLAFN